MRIAGAPQPRTDDIRPLFRVMVVLGAVAILILGLGLVDFFVFEPLGQHSGLSVSVKTVPYDPAQNRVTGAPSLTFNVDQAFAAEVDWGTLPADLMVATRWFFVFGQTVGGSGPAPAGQLRSKTVFPVQQPQGITKNLPGHYTFVVERYSGGQPVEVIGRAEVRVKTSL